MDIKKLALSSISILLVSVGLAACSSSQASKRDTAIKGYKYGSITVPARDGSICNAPNYIAYQEGFFKKNGLKANIVADPRDIGDLEAGFASGKYDVQNGDFQYLPAINNGAQIKAAGGIHQGCIYLLVPKNSSIKSVKDLKGKTIGVPAQGSTPQYVASIALANSGVNPQKDVTWKDYSPDLLPQAVKKGEVQAIGTVDPYAFQDKKQYGYRTLVDNNNSSGNQKMADMGMKKNGSCCYLYLADRLIKSDPSKAKAIVRSYKEAADWINAHPAAAAKVLLNDGWVAKSKFVNEKNVTTILKSEKFDLNLSTGKSDIRFYIEQLKKSGILSKKVNTEELLKKAYWDPKL